MSQNFAIAHLTRLALRQRLLVLVLTFGLIGAGVWAYLGLPIDAFPDVSSTQVKIILKVPGLTPQEVEQRVTLLVEQEMLGIPNKTLLRSLSHYALSDVTIDFEEGTDIYWARQQVNERLSVVLSSLPPTAEGGLAPITTPLGEMYMFTIDGPQTLAERRTQLDWVIRPALRAIPGVADVNALGGVVRTFNVAPNFSALAASQITVEKLIEAIQNNNQNDGAGRVARQGESILVRTEGRIKTLEDLRNIVVGRSGDQLLRVHQLADISIEGLTRYGAVTENGQGETVEGLVLGLRGANARHVGGQGGGHGQQSFAGSHGFGADHPLPVSGQCSFCAGGCHYFAFVGAGHVFVHALGAFVGQPDVSGRAGHCHRHVGGCVRGGG